MLAWVKDRGIGEGRNPVWLVDILAGFEDPGIEGARTVGAAGEVPEGLTPLDDVGSLRARIRLRMGRGLVGEQWSPFGHGR